MPPRGRPRPFTSLSFVTSAMTKAATAPAKPKAAKKDSAGAASAVAPPPRSGAVAYLECTEGTSNKFYEISLAGTSVHSRYGKIGDGGATTTKEFGTAAEAQTFMDKTVKEKTKKGYAA